MAIVEWKKDGTVAIMILNNGENRHNPVWAEAMLSTHAEIMADPEIYSIVLTSSDPKNFCLGVDVEWLGKTMAADDWPAIEQWLHRTGDVFRTLLMSPVPTIAAVTGHAFGNGAMLMGACNFRFMRADRGFFCLPEIDLGIQPAPSMVEWMKRIMPYNMLERLFFSGEKVGAAELEKNNVIMKACGNAEKTLEEAVAFAKKFKKPRANMTEMKIRTYKHIIDKIENEDPRYYKYEPELKKQGITPIFMFTR